MTDTWNVTASYDKSTYGKGDTITATIAGGDVLTNTTTLQGQAAASNLVVTSPDGSTVSTVSLASSPVTITTLVTLAESVRITSVSSTDGRTWTIAANGLSVSAVA